MLVATAGLSLIAPIAAQASEINIEGMNSYSRSKSSKKKKKTFSSKTFSNEYAKVKESPNDLDSQVNDFEASGFSDTTTLDSKAVFTVGGIDAPDPVPASLSESTQFQYSYTMNLNTSFDGDDNLYVRIKTGNGTKYFTWSEKPYGTYLSSANQNSDGVNVDKMWYTKPVGNHTFYIGPKIEN